MKKMANDLWSPADNLPEMEEDDEEYWEVICCNLLFPHQSIVTPGLLSEVSHIQLWLL